MSSLLSYIGIPSSTPASPSSPSSPSLSASRSDFTPSFEWRDLPEGQSITYSGLEVNLTTKQARIPCTGLQLTFNIPCYDRRSVRINVNRDDKISDIYKYIVNEWPGLRGRGFVAPTANAITLKYIDTKMNTITYLDNNLTVESAVSLSLLYLSLSP